MKIEKNWVPTLLNAVRDAMRYNESLLEDENQIHYEEREQYLMYLDDFMDYLKEEYLKEEDQYPLKLEQIIGLEENSKAPEEQAKIIDIQQSDNTEEE